MSTRREELNQILTDVLGSGNVYFQPPESIKMSYPAIVYNRDYIQKRSANDGTYLTNKRYQVTVIDKNPDSEIVDRVAMLPQCYYDRHYKSDGLNHDVFTIYY